MKSLFVLALLSLFVSCHTETVYELVWSDEFNYTGLPDSSKWCYDTEWNTSGWGINELQYYTKNKVENAFVNNGILVITARNDSAMKVPYSSARLISKSKGDWLYGRIEVKAKVAGGKGAWPSIIMLPSENTYGQWPKSGQIDIMEHIGYEPDSVYCSVHTEYFNHTTDFQLSQSMYVPDAKNTYHVYAINWTANKIDFYIDDNRAFTFRKKRKHAEEWPFDKCFYLVLNIAIGGKWGGLYGIDNTIFPCQMEIDYVRVYQMK